MEKSTECVKVIIRVRPMNEREVTKGYQNCVEVVGEANQISLINAKSHAEKTFSYDAVYDTNTTQEKLFDESVFPLVESVLQGYNGTIFAYGQTGCGKTFTMTGNREKPENYGIIPRSITQVFGAIESEETEKNYLVRCSYIEIYNEEIRDLLQDKKKCSLKESKEKGVFIQGLQLLIVKNIQEVDKQLQVGDKNRSTGETLMNDRSSRSHAIFTVYIEQQEVIEGKEIIRAGKLNLVDLAGSERQSKTHAEGQRLKEAQQINLSLSALGNVISALVDGKSTHIPYRDSKLTRLLQDSLGGNTKTIMMAVISPASDSYDESLSTLRYASRAKFIQNKPKINEDPKDALIREYQLEIQRLKELIQQQGSGMNVQQLAQMFGNSEIFKSTLTQQKTVDLQKVDVERKKQKEKIKSEAEQINSQLREKEQMINQEKEERERLFSQVEALQQQLVRSGTVIEQQKKDQIKQQRELQLKLQKQKDIEKKLVQQKQKQEEQFLWLEKNYQNIEEEKKDQEIIIKKLRKKLKNQMAEVEDLQKEQAQNRGELMETIRTQELDIDFLKKAVLYVISEEEIEKVKKKSKFNVDNYE